MSRTSKLYFLTLALFLIGASVNAEVFGQAVNNPGVAFSGTVLSSGSNRDSVEGATVHLIPVEKIDLTPITGSTIFEPPFAAEAHDEPLEDAIRNSRASLAFQVTDDAGRFSFPKVENGRYFVHVSPPDARHLPGGSLSRKALDASELRGKTVDIWISSRPPKESTFIGTSGCLSCHNEIKHPNWHFRRTGHRLAWSVPGKAASNQEFRRFPDWSDALRFWKRGFHHKDGTKLELGDPDPSERRITARFKIREAGDQRVPLRKVFAEIYLWQDIDDNTLDEHAEPKRERFIITVINKINPSQSQPIHIPLEMLYGGGVHRQRYIVSVPKVLGDRQGLYTLLQYNMDGDDRRLNPNRRLWRDYKFGYWWDKGDDRKYGGNDDRLVAPIRNLNTIQAECAGCHVTGGKRSIVADLTAEQILVEGIADDHFGAFNLDADTMTDEVNVGCEACHGPGSKHRLLFQNNEDVGAVEAQLIINPARLAAERSDAICGKCHDRRRGNTNHSTTEAVNAKGDYFPPGESRHVLLTEYSRKDYKGPKPGNDLWPDDLHSSKPRQQYSEHVKSAHYRNRTQLVACADCHGSHGETVYSSWLKGDPDDPSSAACGACHDEQVQTHLWLNSHPKLASVNVSCISCHMPGTSQPGADAGAPGLYADLPPFESAAEEAEAVYWNGNLNSHVFDVPRKTNPGVWGASPVKAMPIPYTSSCGYCHDVASISRN